MSNLSVALPFSIDVVTLSVWPSHKQTKKAPHHLRTFREHGCIYVLYQI